MRVPPRIRRTAAVAGLAALAALAGAACDKESSCRPGTVFVHIDPGAHVTANQVGIDVSVEGGAPIHTSLPIPAGSRGGGVEVQFPSGYPSGKSVAITVTLSAGATVLASQRVDRVLTGECLAVEIGFRTADGGGGGAGGTSGGGGSIAGASGTSGGGGTAGAGGATAGAGGTGGAAGGGGTAGSGATAGRGGAGGTSGGGGTTGAAGRGGNGGMGGTAGSGATAGRGGMGGTAGGGGTTGAAGRGGAGGTGGAPCVPTAEFCYNGADDDCDGKIDCADTDCMPSTQCVALDAAGARIGLMVAATASCPANYTDMTALYQTLSGAACAGCSCRPPTLSSCSATIASFATAADCQTASSAGTAEGSLSSTQACTTPNWVGSMFGQILGIQAGTFQPTLTGSCVPQGTPTPGAPTWATSGRFCAATMVGAGCATGQICVPAVTPSKCVMWEGVHTCQVGTTMTYWNTGFTDTRTCGACTCGAATGQSCAGMRIQVGTDYTCSPQVTATLSSGQRYCYSGNGVYSPGIVFTGTATQPTCPGSTTTGGTLTPTGQKTLCCM